VSKGVVAVGADTWAVEAIPFEKEGDKDGPVFGVHQILLPMSGTYILENINTAELAKDKAWESCSCSGRTNIRVRCSR